MNFAQRMHPGVGAHYEESARGIVPDGDDGTMKVVQIMRAMGEDAAHSPLVQRAASEISAQAHGAEPIDRLHSLYHYLRQHIAFKPDTLNAETIRHPEQLLTEIYSTGKAAADCDDVATLAAAIMRAMGIQPLFVLVARRPGPFEHVHPAAIINDEIMPFDPQEGYELGHLTPGVRRVTVDA